MKLKKSFLHIINSERGSVAIMLVLTAVALVTPFVVNFTFDTQVNKMKTENIEDRAKAKLTAESGLKFAMVRLRLYKEAYNFLQNNKDAKKSVQQEMLDTIWNFPFVYPIPEMKSMNLIQKQAIQKFQEETFLHGSLQLTIQNISNRLNLNALRLSLIADAIKESQKVKKGGEDDEEEGEDENREFDVESQLLSILKDAMIAEGEKDETFFDLYDSLELGVLINELKYFISDPNSVEDAQGGNLNFQGAELAAKRSPLSSYSEVFGLPEWPDEITNLIKREFTVHGAIMIDLNKITDKFLRILIPDITPEDVVEFFEYKDNPEDPQYFNSLEDFKNYIVNVANIMTDSDFDERFKKYLSQGLQFGPTPTLFKIESVSSVERATYTINAYVVIPAQPKPRQVQKTEEGDGEDEEPPATNEGEDDENEGEGEDGEGTESGGTDETEKEEQKTLLLEPRIVEITVS